MTPAQAEKILEDPRDREFLIHRLALLYPEEVAQQVERCSERLDRWRLFRDGLRHQEVQLREQPSPPAREECAPDPKPASAPTICLPPMPPRFLAALRLWAQNPTVPMRELARQRGVGETAYREYLQGAISALLGPATDWTNAGLRERYRQVLEVLEAQKEPRQSPAGASDQKPNPVNLQS